jgi:hypothetical protein
MHFVFKLILLGFEIASKILKMNLIIILILFIAK